LVDIEAEKGLDGAKNIGRDGSGKRDDERQKGISEPLAAVHAEFGRRKRFLKRFEDVV
jgi:hypothetical protein